MGFGWLKRYMPRSLFGRAALIVLLPVATIILVVSVVFVQRHFQDVTRQLSRETARALEVAFDGGPEILAALEFTVSSASGDTAERPDDWRWYDLTGPNVASVLREELEGVRRVVLPDDRRVLLYLDRGGEVLEVRFSRRRASAANPHQLLVNMVGFGGLFTLVAFIYLRNQLRPITRLAKAAEAFGRGRTEPYSPSGALEVRAAGAAFLSMRARIERQIEQRTMMLSGVSHDMRTPLTRMKLELSMLDGPERAALERDVTDLERLLEAFLSFARGEAEAGPSERVEFVPFVTDIVDNARRGGADVSFVGAEGGGMVMLRPISITRAVENLIGNAVRYASRCEVSVQVSERAARIRVEDDGPGIPEAQRETALKAFARLDPARNQDQGSGVGLGLAIAADIARSHGGSLRLGESARLGGLSVDLVLGRS